MTVQTDSPETPEEFMDRMAAWVLKDPAVVIMALCAEVVALHKRIVVLERTPYSPPAPDTSGRIPGG